MTLEQIPEAESSAEVTIETPVEVTSETPIEVAVEAPVEVPTEAQLEQEEGAVPPEEEPPVASRTRQQVGKSILRPSKYTMATKLDKRTEKDPVKLAAIRTAEIEEIKQFFEG